MRQFSKPTILLPQLVFLPLLVVLRLLVVLPLLVFLTVWVTPSIGLAQQRVPPVVVEKKQTVAENELAKESATADPTDLKSCEVKTENFVDVANRAAAEIRKHGVDKVLLVVDVDNTTLAMDQPLGSDQWYGWQYDFIFRGVESPFRVAKDLNELLRIQGTLFELGSMHPPEPSLPELLSAIQEAGCTTIVLTSRGPEFRAATERELERNGYDFADSALKINEPARGRFLPYDKARPNTHGLSKQELESLRDPRPVSYSRGIYMTAGQHKGYMLRNLLARSPRTFNAIVFADDHDKHTMRMTQAFSDSNITTACFHYVREQPNVDAFKESDKEAIAKTWAKLSDSIAEAFDASKE
jgi:hypothetical protein